LLARATPVVEGDRVEYVTSCGRAAREQGAGVRVVDPQSLQLELGSSDAGRVLQRDRVDRVLRERDRKHELADVVEQAGQVRRAAARAAALGGRRGVRGDRDRMQMHLPA